MPTKDKITAAYLQQLLAGIYFRFENLTTQPAELKMLSTRSAELTFHEDRYHQKKRMFGYCVIAISGLPTLRK